MKHNIKLFLILVCVMIFSSCDDFLEHYPLDAPSDETYFSTETELNMALIGCYNTLWSEDQSLPLPLAFEYATDNGYERNASSLQAMGQGVLDARNATVVNYWRFMYQGISRCNNLLDNMNRAEDKVMPDFYNRVKAEARFLRAFYYHYLVELYGDVPLITSVIGLSDSQNARTPKSQVVDFILNELDGCCPDLVSGNEPESGKASKATAMALKARVALYNERWEIAAAAAQEVMNMEGTEVQLSDNFPGLFAYSGQNDKEILFSIQYLKGEKVHSCYRFFGTRNAQAHTNKKPAYQLSDVFECTDGLQIDKSPLFDPKHPYENRDPRLQYSLCLSGSEFLGFQYETHGDSTECWSYRTDPPIRIANLEATHAYATFTGIGFRKYANIEDKDNVDDCDNNIILIRYAEILLSYAEAKIELGQIDQSVLDAINKVRQRPGVDMPPILTTDQTKLKYAVRRERRYEFTQEGLRFFDIRRWRIAEDVMNMPVLGRMKKSYPDIAPRIDENGTPHYENIPIAGAGESADFKMRLVDVRNFEDYHYLWPIPYVEMQTNLEMVQNPGY